MAVGPGCRGASKKPKASSTRGRARGGPLSGVARRLRQALAKRWASSKRRGPLSSRLLVRPAAAMQRPGAPSHRKRKLSPPGARASASGSRWGSSSIGSPPARGRARLRTPSSSSWCARSLAAASKLVNESPVELVKEEGACTRKGRGRDEELLKCMGPAVAAACGPHD